MLTLPITRVFTATSRAVSTVFVAAVILSTAPRALHAYQPCNYETGETSDKSHVRQELHNLGRITSPGFPEAYRNCAEGWWSLLASPNCTVLLNIVEFDVANFTDRLFVYEMGEAPKVVELLSGKVSNRTLQLNTRNVHLVFLAHIYDALADGRLGENGFAPLQPRRRFVIDFTSRLPDNASASEQSAIDRNDVSPDTPTTAGLPLHAHQLCNYEGAATSDKPQVMQELHNQGRITSPGFPEAFPNCAKGWWSLLASPNCTVLLNFVEFDVVNFTDRLFVYEMGEAPKVVAEISGKVSNQTLQLNESNVQLAFLAHIDDALADGRLGENGFAPPQPRRRFVIDFTSWPPDSASACDQSAIYRNGASADTPSTAGLLSSQENVKTKNTSKLIVTVLVAVASLVFCAITLGAVYFILWKQTGHLFSYRRFFGNRSRSTAELRSDTATSTARRETSSSPARSTVYSGCSYDNPNCHGTTESSFASPFAPPPPQETTIVTASV